MQGLVEGLEVPNGCQVQDDLQLMSGRQAPSGGPSHYESLKYYSSTAKAHAKALQNPEVPRVLAGK